LIYGKLKGTFLHDNVVFSIHFFISLFSPEAPSHEKQTKQQRDVVPSIKRTLGETMGMSKEKNHGVNLVFPSWPETSPLTICQT
jgi:hypothetical protein